MTSQQTISEHRQSLETAFGLFNQLSEQLSGSYQQLQQQVLVLSRELAAARNERLLQLAEKERLADRLKRLLETLPAAVILLGPDHGIREFNPAAVALFPDIAVDRHWPGLLAEHLRTEQPAGSELHLHSGKVLSISSSFLEQSAGQILVMLDVTAARKLQERLERQQRLGAMGEMSAQLAHQMRTPLSSALLYASHLSNLDLSDEQRRRFSGKLQDRLRHMERQISDILMFARGSSAVESDICLAELLGEFAEGLSPQLQQAGASLRLELDEGRDTRIQGRRDALLGVLGNLADNALRHGAKLIRIHLHGGERVRLTFADDGQGIPAEYRDRIFDPFFTTRSDGTGLGLAVVQNILLHHRAEIRLLDGTGEGTTFGLEFPSAAFAAAIMPFRDAVGPFSQHAAQPLRSLS